MRTGRALSMGAMVFPTRENALASLTRWGDKTRWDDIPTLSQNPKLTRWWRQEVEVLESCCKSGGA